MKGYSTEQRKLATAIMQFTTQHGYGPVIKDLLAIHNQCRERPVRLDTLYEQLRTMQRKQFLDWADGSMRTVHLTLYGLLHLLDYTEELHPAITRTEPLSHEAHACLFMHLMVQAIKFEFDPQFCRTDLGVHCLLQDQKYGCVSYGDVPSSAEVTLAYEEALAVVLAQALSEGLYRRERLDKETVDLGIEYHYGKNLQASVRDHVTALMDSPLLEREGTAAASAAHSSR